MGLRGPPSTKPHAGARNYRGRQRAVPKEPEVSHEGLHRLAQQRRSKRHPAFARRGEIGRGSRRRPMITLRRAKERHHDRRRKQEAWLTFYPGNRADPLADGFGVLEILDEDRVPPGARVSRHPQHDVEILTYVRKGPLAYEDSMGRSGVIHTGEFQHMTARRAVRHSETNASRSDWAHLFQIGLHSSVAGFGPGYEQKRF